ncbi:MAG TPA: cupredoxin domain-containing protein [Patescibacteria group bacterium]|nr:cupredoxin domain-containing protein [Patescibacteria group bacterium]
MSEDTLNTVGTTRRTLKIGLVLLGAIALAVIATMLIDHFTKRQSVSGVQVTINVQHDGFSPAVMTIRSGTTVTWVNADSQPHRVTSTPFPSHTDLPGLDSRQNIGPGSKYSYTYTKTGTFGYLDYLHPELNGSIQVK